MFACSFCGKAKADVLRLFHGPGVSVCNECVDLFVHWDEYSDLPLDEDKFMEGLTGLSESDRRVLRIRCGLDGHGPRTVGELAEALGISVAEARGQLDSASKALKDLQARR